MIVKSISWLSWLLGLALHASIVLMFGNEIGFPFWILIFSLVAMEGVPLLWILKIIRKTPRIDRNFVVGYWFVWQIAFFIFCAIACAIQPGGIGILSVFVKIIFMTIIGLFMYSRTINIAILFSEYSK